jgi:signal peptidase I
VVGTMVDNLHDGQYLIIDKLNSNSLVSNILGMGGPRRGDVIVFRRPISRRVRQTDHRLAGEQVEIRNGRVLINGQPLAEPFQPTPAPTPH